MPGKEFLRMEHIRKVYSNGVVANSDITFTVDHGEIHALSGENGAGKTTLMKMLFGEEQPTRGDIYINGEKTVITSSATAIRLGIGMVHQHFMLVPSLTVIENMILGMEPKKGLVIDQKLAERQVSEISEKYNLLVPPHARVQDLTVGQKQKVEILKALFHGAKLLILDEPTAVLTPQETRELFQELKILRDSGYTIIFISHKLNAGTVRPHYHYSPGTYNGSIPGSGSQRGRDFPFDGGAGCCIAFREKACSTGRTSHPGGKFDRNEHTGAKKAGYDLFLRQTG